MFAKTIGVYVRESETASFVSNTIMEKNMVMINGIMKFLCFKLFNILKNIRLFLSNIIKTTTSVIKLINKLNKLKETSKIVHMTVMISKTLIKDKNPTMNGFEEFLNIPFSIIKVPNIENIK